MWFRCQIPPPPPFFGWRVCYSCYIRTCHKKIGRWGCVVLLLNHTPPSKILKRVYFSCYISPPPNFLRWGCVVSLLNHTPPFLLAGKCAIVVISDPATKNFGGWRGLVSLLNHPPSKMFKWVFFSCYISSNQIFWMGGWFPS